MQPFITKLRVRYHEMDALGHVNHAVYLSYLEQAAIEHLESLGLSLNSYQEMGGIFVLRRMEVDYLRSAIASDTLEIKTWLQTMRGTRVIRKYEICRHGETELLLAAEALWVWVDAVSMRPKAIPNPLVELFESLMGEEGKNLNSVDK